MDSNSKNDFNEEEYDFLIKKLRNLPKETVSENFDEKSNTIIDSITPKKTFRIQIAGIFTALNFQRLFEQFTIRPVLAYGTSAFLIVGICFILFLTTRRDTNLIKSKNNNAIAKLKEIPDSESGVNELGKASKSPNAKEGAQSEGNHVRNLEEYQIESIFTELSQNRSLSHSINSFSKKQIEYHLHSSEFNAYLAEIKNKHMVSRGDTIMYLIQKLVR